jgi:hypothetical protein
MTIYYLPTSNYQLPSTNYHLTIIIYHPPINQLTNQPKICKTNPIPEEPKMSLSHYIISDYDNKSDLLTMEKQTQTKPILKVNPLLKIENHQSKIVNLNCPLHAVRCLPNKIPAKRFRNFAL